MYRPKEAAQMTTPFHLQVPTMTVTLGVRAKVWTTIDGVVMANMKTYGGTERTDNNILSVEDTAQIVTWYRPDIKGDCRLIRLTDNSAYEILGEPEDIEQRHQLLSIKVRRIKGGA